MLVVSVMILAKRFYNSSTSLLKKQFEEDTGEVAATDAKAMSERKLPAGLSRELMPKHVAFIADGNRRWAKMNGMPSILGHGAGARSVLRLVDICCNWGIEVMTVFTLSSENWVRPRIEIDFLMKVIQRNLKEQLEFFMRKRIQVSVIGDHSKLSTSLQKWITKTTETTKHNKRLHLILAINYSGREDIVQACQSISRKAVDNLIKVEDMDETIFSQQLKTNCTEFPYPDLLIRTSGEQRISNFLMWQLADTELYFDESLWPDFGEKEFVKALLSLQERRRRRYEEELGTNLDEL
ncbi:hypothetical protein MKX01_001710 [Papaver californicum]|nr:hypothetical protein MKX01_001710 [Papaver californicum]